MPNRFEITSEIEQVPIDIFLQLVRSHKGFLDRLFSIAEYLQ